MKILVLGANGYTGQRLVPQLLAREHEVRVLVRSDLTVPGVDPKQVDLRVGNVADVESLRTVTQDMDVVFNLVGYCREDTRVMRTQVVDGTRNLVEVTDPRRLVKYIMASTVAVYGHPAPDAKLDENTPAKPDYPVGREALAAEQTMANAMPTVIVRVPQIYGPGRDYIQSVREGRVRILNRGDNYQSRIHVEDLVAVLLAAMEQGEAGQTYLAGDDQPVRVKDFFTELAQVLDAPEPLPLEANAAKVLGLALKAQNWLAGQTAHPLNENVVGMLTGNYFCKNDKIKSGLGVQLKYPTYADGYEAMLKGGAK